MKKIKRKESPPTTEKDKAEYMMRLIEKTLSKLNEELFWGIQWGVKIDINVQNSELPIGTLPQITCLMTYHCFGLPNE